MKRFLHLLLFLAGATTPAPPPAATPPPVHVVIVGTTDVHGWFNGHDEVTPDKRAVHFGGLATFSSYVDALRGANPGRVIVVDSGDLFQGTLESNLFEGAPVIGGYNAIGYAAAAVGNHEFDYGPVGPDPVARTPDQDPLGALKVNISRAKFPFLAANITEKATGKAPSWAKPYTIVNAGGAKVGIIGLSTPDTPNTTMEQNVHALDFGDPVPATVAAARALRAQGADAVIVIAHMGGRCKVIDQDPHDSSSCEVNQEAMRFLAALPPATIDGYFAGHTHSTMRHYINGVPALQGGALSREFSTLDVWIDPKSHHVLADKTEIRPLTMICAQVWSGMTTCDPRDGKGGKTLVPRTFEGRTIEPDARLTAFFKPYLDKVAARKKEPTGIRTAAVFHRSFQHESELGDLLTDAFRTATNTDVAFINSGGIRADLRAGDLTYGDIFETCPFDNYAAVVELTGAQIEYILRVVSTGDHGFLQTSGLKYTVDVARDKHDRIVDVMLTDGRTLDREKLYKVAMPDFLLDGGEGTASIMKSVPPSRQRLHREMGSFRELFIHSLSAFPQPLMPKKEGRIVVLNEKGRSEND